jgi:hypothetical protein
LVPAIVTAVPTSALVGVRLAMIGGVEAAGTSKITSADSGLINPDMSYA